MTETQSVQNGRACAKKIIDCSEQLKMNANCLKAVAWLRVDDLAMDETTQAGEYLIEAVKLQQKAMEILSRPLV
jgi:hypothetical protein